MDKCSNEDIIVKHEGVIGVRKLLSEPECVERINILI